MELLERLREDLKDFFKHIQWLVRWGDKLQRGLTEPLTFSEIFFAFIRSQSTKSRGAAYALVSLAACLCPSWSPKDLAINYQKPDYHVFWDLVFELDDTASDTTGRYSGGLSDVRNRIVGRAESSTWFENAHSEL